MPAEKIAVGLNGHEDAATSTEVETPEKSPAVAHNTKEQGKAALELYQINEESNDGKKHPEENLRFPEDPNQYTEAELFADPAKRYHVNPKDFPIFSRQTQLKEGADQKRNVSSTDVEVVPIDKTMSDFVTNTADTVAILSGENEAGIPQADHVIYLDKSARPVSWLVNTFWDEFSDKKRPEQSFLAIDRKDWFYRTGTELLPREYVRAADGSQHLATINDFKAENITREHLARIRALYIPGGIEDGPIMNEAALSNEGELSEEAIDKIMNTPTGLDGKNITIIDEVSRSGSTLGIAKKLIAMAIPEAASVNGYAFWHAGVRKSEDDENQMLGAPVWYNENDNTGRGTGDIDENDKKDRYEKIPTPRTRAKAIGGFIVGTPVDLSKEKDNRSRQLMKEIQTMKKEWDAGHILMSYPEQYDQDKREALLESQGIVFVPADTKPMPKNAYVRVREDFNNRR